MSRIVSFRYVAVEPTKHYTRCQSCHRSVEDEVMYLLRVIRKDNVEPDVSHIPELAPPWYLACLRCYSEIESEANRQQGVEHSMPVRGIRLADTHRMADGMPLCISHAGVWNEEF